MANSLNDFLVNEGVSIAIILGVGLAIWITGGIVCYLIIRAFVTTGVAARQVSRKASTATANVGQELVRVTTHEPDHEDEEKGGHDQDEDDAVESKDNSNGTSTPNNSAVDLVSGDEKKSIQQRARTIGGVIRSTGNMLIYAIVVIGILDVIGAPSNSLLSFLALGSLTMALALSRGVTDFVSGMFILVEGSYNVGEIVTLNGIFGTVERMTLRASYLRGLDGTLYTIPNGTITAVANHNRGFSATVTDVGITYESDANKCIEILNNEVCEAVLSDERIKGKILNTPCVDGIGELAGSSVNIRFLVVAKPGLQAVVQRVTNDYVHKYLRTYLAYPTARIIAENADSEDKDDVKDDKKDENEAKSNVEVAPNPNYFNSDVQKAIEALDVSEEESEDEQNDPDKKTSDENANANANEQQENNGNEEPAPLGGDGGDGGDVASGDVNDENEDGRTGDAAESPYKD